MRWDNNQPEVGCKCGQASQGTVLRHPALAGRKPNRKMAILALQIGCQYPMVIYRRVSCDISNVGADSTLSSERVSGKSGASVD
jgi:hypothetical protein